MIPRLQRSSVRLNFSKSEETPLYKLREWFFALAELPLRQVLLREPRYLSVLLQEQGVLTEKKSLSKAAGKEILKDLFLSKIVGPHRALRGIFAPLTEKRALQCSIGGHLIYSVLGTGSDGCAFRTEDGYCLKVVDISKKDKLAREYELLKELKHKNIVRCFDFICDRDCAALLLEVLDHTPGDERAYLEGIQFCHSKNILHGDIRVKNLGTDDRGNSKLFDFGNAVTGASREEMELEKETLKHLMRSFLVAAGQNVIVKKEISC